MLKHTYICICMRCGDSGVLVMESKLKFYCVGQHKLSNLRVMFIKHCHLSEVNGGY